MKIKFDYTFEVDRKKFPNLTAEEIRDHFVSCAMSYMQHVEEETLNLLADVNIENKKK
jgi:flagellar assembly factor FliW